MFNTLAHITEILLLSYIAFKLGDLADMGAASALRDRREGETIMGMKEEVDALVAQVEQNRTVEASGRVAILGMLDIIANAASTGDITRVQEAVAKLKASADDLNSAIPASTPAATA